MTTTSKGTAIARGAAAALVGAGVGAVGLAVASSDVSHDATAPAAQTTPLGAQDAQDRQGPQGRRDQPGLPPGLTAQAQAQGQAQPQDRAQGQGQVRQGQGMEGQGMQGQVVPGGEPAVGASHGS